MSDTEYQAGMEPSPTTRAEAREQFVPYLAAGPTYELTAEPAEPFLSLTVRRVLYLAGLTALVLAPSVGVNLPEYAQAIETAGNLLGAAALGTALANPTR